MPMIGKSLAHYSITAEIGKGGMGEVYQAKDQKLGRDVAIKILPEEFSHDADRVARFQREAKLLASLNHQNIAAIYGLEESDGTNFIVMELIEGDTLADQIKTGAIPVKEALKLALQIAEALEAAHEKGVIHRDLKPANIKVTPDGKVKVLDFGLAKVFAGEQADLNLSNSPTLSVAATQQGVILGTAAYMSPEQARGKSVDQKADVWAFGVVLFEMLTGKPLFSGDDISQTLARVLERKPDFSTLPTYLHPKIVEMLERCLEKEARNRYSGIADARVDIQKVLADRGGALVPPPAKAGSGKTMSWIASAIALTALIVGTVVWILRPSPPSEPKRVIRFTYELPIGQQFSTTSRGNGITLAISPDGDRFVYGTTDGLYLREMDQLDARHISGTNKDSLRPFFSPDGKWIGYFSSSDRKLKKVAISGGAPVSICDPGPLGDYASWSSDNTILYSDPRKGVMRVSADGGTPDMLIKGSAKEGFPVAHQMLPDGKTLLFSNILPKGSQLVVQSLKSSQRTVLVDNPGGFGIYLPTGHLVYSTGGGFCGVSFDLHKLKITCDPVPLIGYGWNSFVSNSGTLVSIPLANEVRAVNESSLVWVDQKGKEEPIPATAGYYGTLRISPDGTKVAVTIRDRDNRNKSNIWILDLIRGPLTPLTRSEGSDRNPIWTPYSKEVIFNSDREGWGIYMKAANGTGEAKHVFSLPGRYIAPGSISGDGKTLLFAERGVSMDSGGEVPNWDISMLSMEGEQKKRVLLKDTYDEQIPEISPKGQYMAYESTETGRPEVYIRSFPDVNKERQPVSTNGGQSPIWSPDGKQLYYLARSDDIVKILAVTVETEPILKLGPPKELFQGQYLLAGWDIHPKSKKFLMVKPPASISAALAAPIPRKVNIVLNWFEELKDRVPVN
jgi:serine/threonine protein kinase/Tol biopolymer transport system component